MMAGEVAFLAAVAGLIVMLGGTLWSGLRGSRRAAFRWGAGAGLLTLAYAMVLVAASLSAPVRWIEPGAEHCSDDICFAVAAVTPPAAGSGGAWRVTLQVRSDAKRVTQSIQSPIELAIVDDEGRRFPPAGADAWPHGLTLAPGESAQHDVLFPLPSDVDRPALIFREAAWIGRIVAGDERSFLHAPVLFRLTPVR